MKKIVLAIIGLMLILLVSYIAISYESDSYTLKTFVIEDNKENTKTDYHNMKTFVIGQKLSGWAMLMHIKKQTQDARKRNLMYEERDEEIQKCIDKITKNWKRTYYKRSYEKEYDDVEKKWEHVEGSPFYEKRREIHGYDEDEDWDLRWRLKNRALDEEKIC